MTEIVWNLTGQYAENCSCEYLCPCIVTNSTALSKPATAEVGDHCIAVIALNIAEGRYDDIKLDGLSFLLVLKTRLVMSEGHWTTAVIIDEKASPQQRDALEIVNRDDLGMRVEDQRQDSKAVHRKGHQRGDQHERPRVDAAASEDLHE